LSLLIDGLAHEYGWTPGQILDLPITGAIMLIQRINERYSVDKHKRSQRIMSIGELENLMRG